MTKMVTLAGTTLVPIRIDELRHLRSPNPNVMSPDRFELLKASIEANGFLQPIVVYEEGGAFVLVDGEHRIKACDQLGKTEVLAVVAPDRDKAEAAARALRISMNKLRGELNHTAVGRELLELDELAPMVDFVTGFSDAEKDALRELVSQPLEDDLLSGTNLAVEQEVAPKTFNIVLKFDSESRRAHVRELLAQHGDTPEDALLELLRSGGDDQ